MKKGLPKNYNSSDYEDGIYRKWEESGFFNPDNLSAGEDAPVYSIVMPPPNVTGTLHLGHAAMLAIEDILIRHHRMKGEKALWIPGADHAAIATQTKVEKILKEEGTDRHKLGREEFIKRVEKFAQDSRDTIVSQIKKMGSSCDWSREAYTLDETRTKAVRSVFKMMYDDGLVYRGERIVNWCPRCHSTLADDEVEYKQQKAKLYAFKYAKDFPFAIATTRPETKLGDTAVAVNPGDARYKKYIGREYKIDFAGIGLKIKIIGDRTVDPEFGTGAVGVTPAHSMADWQMAENHNLKIIKVIDEDGKIKTGFGKYAGKTAPEARELIVSEIKKSGLMEKEEETDNNLSLCYRCDTPVEPLPSLQWFIDVNKKISKYNKSIKELSAEAVEKGVFGRGRIKIYPKRFEKNYFHWMDNLRDWCVSRQIWFGHRVPVWYNRMSDGEKYVGVEAPEGKDWEQDTDTLDTWFSSGLWTFSTLARSPKEIKIKDGKLVINGNDFKNYHPTAVLETGYDILFFWIARMIIMTTYAVGDIPFRDVYLHGLVLDEKGKKMSKSKGNAIDPLEMSAKYGADAVRLSLIVGATPGNDIKINEEKIAACRNFINKLWNIARYALSNYELQIINYELDEADFTPADIWIMEKMKTLISEVGKDLKTYRFAQAGDRLKEFTWNDLADWYLEASKFEKNKSKKIILAKIIKDLLKLWHPFIPFVTEAIWKNLGRDKLLMVEAWPRTKDYRIKAAARAKGFELAKNVIIAIRNARSENKVEPARKLKAVIFSKRYKDLLAAQKELIASLRTSIKEIEIREKPARAEEFKDAIFASAPGVEIYLPQAVDRKKEAERIGKEIANLEKLIAGLKDKLANKEFAAKAPAAIVAGEKNRLAAAEEELKKLKGKCS